MLAPKGIHVLVLLWASSEASRLPARIDQMAHHSTGLAVNTSMQQPESQRKWANLFSQPTSEDSESISADTDLICIGFVVFFLCCCSGLIAVCRGAWDQLDSENRLNDEGFDVHCGSGPGVVSFYCGQVRFIHESEKRCGPNSGPQCDSCIRYQMRTEGNKACPKGHRLVRHEETSRPWHSSASLLGKLESPLRECDSCHQRFYWEEQAAIYSCHQCDFDLCAACHESQQQDPPESAGTKLEQSLLYWQRQQMQERQQSFQQMTTTDASISN